ncbi:hypothetical protein BTBSAS_40024 [Brochothrix thermosphacta]|uniref:Uncharacterized protein n=1 Tax=Brochothrix thermosphacta TaxID=2756 RepID=A0A2X0R4H3_BROTH|nr:hypothetical protein BTBSAS_40024 [Brochothrix thermosphacta]
MKALKNHNVFYLFVTFRPIFKSRELLVAVVTVTHNNIFINTRLFYLLS